MFVASKSWKTVIDQSVLIYDAWYESCNKWVSASSNVLLSTEQLNVKHRPGCVRPPLSQCGLGWIRVWQSDNSRTKHALNLRDFAWGFNQTSLENSHLSSIGFLTGSRTKYAIWHLIPHVPPPLYLPPSPDLRGAAIQWHVNILNFNETKKLL